MTCSTPNPNPSSNHHDLSSFTTAQPSLIQLLTEGVLAHLLPMEQQWGDIVHDHQQRFIDLQEVLEEVRMLLDQDDFDDDALPPFEPLQENPVNPAAQQ